MKDTKLLSNEEIASFCNQTAMLFQAGFTPVQSMRILLSDAKNADAKELLSQILEICSKGEPFHKALKATEVFPDYVVNMLAIGAESGDLDVCMLSLAAYYEKEQAISDNIKSAVTYPFIMIAMMIVVIFVLISKVMPIFNQVFLELGSEMSGFSASLMRLGSSLNKYSVVFLALLCLIAILWILATRTQTGRRITASFLNAFPLTRNFYASVACQRFASGMALTIGTGMDVGSSLEMVSAMVGHKKMKEKIAACQNAIKEGDNFAEALVNANIFNNLYSQMVGVGFKSGNIDVVMNKIAEEYEKETDHRIQTIISVLEPSLVIILSVIVGLILLSVILPLMGIMASIG